MFMKIELQAMEGDISHESVRDEVQILVANGSLLNTCVLKNGQVASGGEQLKGITDRIALALSPNVKFFTTIYNFNCNLVKRENKPQI